MNENNENKCRDFGYVVGKAFGLILVACLAAISIACTVKVIMWIL